MIDKLLDDIEVIAVSLERLKSLLGISRIEDDDWEVIADVLNDYSLRLRSTVDAIRSSRRDSETCYDRSDGKGVLQANA